MYLALLEPDAGDWNKNARRRVWGFSETAVEAAVSWQIFTSNCFSFWRLESFSIPVQVLHSQISSIEKQATTATGCPLLIRCKNFQVIQLVIPQERDCHDVYISLIRLARPGMGKKHSTKVNPPLEWGECNRWSVAVHLSSFQFKRKDFIRDALW